MTFLDWGIMGSDTLCPVYSEAVPLESDYRHNSYSVSLEFPTWEELNEAETVLAKRYSQEIKEYIDIDSYVSISRGEGVLNYSFVPIIRQDGKYRKLT